MVACGFTMRLYTMLLLASISIYDYYSHYKERPTSPPRVAVRRGLGDDVVHARPAPQAEQRDPASFETHFLELDLLLRVVVQGYGVRPALAAAAALHGLYKQVVARCFDASRSVVIVTGKPFGHDAADLRPFPGSFWLFQAAYFVCITRQSERSAGPGSRKRSTRARGEHQCAHEPVACQVHRRE